MTAPVRIESEAWSDLRFATLARLMRFADLDHALIKVSRIWSWQTEHYTPDEPTYVVDIDIVESALGTGGSAAMVRARLAEEVPEGLRIRGAVGRIEWLYQRRVASAKGGEARKRNAARNNKPGGLASGYPGQQPEPSPLPLALPPEEDHPPVRDPAPAPQPAPDAQDQQRVRRRAITAELWRELGAVRGVIASDLGIEARPLPAIGDPGERALAMRLLSAGDEQLDRVAADARHAIAVVAAEARATRSVQWLTGALFEDRSWRRAVGMTLDDAARPRAGPASSAERAQPKPIRAKRADDEPPPMPSWHKQGS